MKPQYDNRTMTPPEDKPTKSELDQDGFEQSALKYVQALYKVDEVYDLYEHDKEVALRFHKWMMDYNSIHLVDILAGKIQPTMDEMWERFCK